MASAPMDDVSPHKFASRSLGSGDASAPSWLGLAVTLFDQRPKRRPTEDDAEQDWSGQDPSTSSKLTEEIAKHASKKLRRSRVAEHELSEMVEESVPAARMLNNLVKFEKALDTFIQRKRVESISLKPLKAFPLVQTLRIRVYNTFSVADTPSASTAAGVSGSAPPPSTEDSGQDFLDQLFRSAETGTSAGPAPSASSSQPTVSWTLKIEGKILPPPLASSSPLPPRKMTAYLKKIFIQFEQTLVNASSGSHTIEWSKDTSGESDGFEITRQSDKPLDLSALSIPVKILIERDFGTNCYKVLEPLASVLGISTGPLSQIQLALWQYIRKNKLQDPDSKGTINCDEPLKKAFKTAKFQFMQIPQLLSTTISYPDPIEIPYAVRFNEAASKPSVCYDVDVFFTEGLKEDFAQFNSMYASSQSSVAELQEQIQSEMQEIEYARIKKDFMEDLSDSPRELMDEWMLSQVRDLKVMSYLPSDAEKERHSEFFSKPWVYEGVHRYMFGKLSKRRVETEAPHRR